MMMRNMILVVSAVLSCHPAAMAQTESSLRSQDFILVTSRNGYLLDGNDQVARIVPFLTLLDVESVSDPYFKVEGGLRIHRASVHCSSDFEYMSQNLQGARNAMQLLSQAANIDGDTAKALQTARQALEELRKTFAKDTPATAWFHQIRAGLQYSADDLKAANVSLDVAEEILQEIGQQRHLQAADVLNMRALLRAQEGSHLEAIRLFHEALLILSADLGDNHRDGATIRTNLSYSYHATGDATQAARSQLLATRSLERVLPPAAIEIPQAYARLADLYLSDGRPRDAILLYRNAIALYRQHHPGRAVEIVNGIMGIGDGFKGQQDYEASEKEYLSGFDELGAIDRSDAVGLRKALLNRQGLLDVEQTQYDKAREHFLEAIALVDEENLLDDDLEYYKNVGNTFVAMDKPKEAKQFYKTTLKRFASAAGETSNAVLRMDEGIRALSAATDGSLDDVVMVAEQPAYMLADDGTVMTTVPPFTVLDWISRTEATDTHDASYTVAYDGKTGRIDATQIRSGRMLPGYFEASAELFKTVVQSVAEANAALADDDLQSAKDRLEETVKRCVESVGEKSTLTLWVQSFQFRGHDDLLLAVEFISTLGSRIAERPKGDYPVEIDFLVLTALSFLANDNAAAAVDSLLRVREIAAARLGSYHVDVLRLNRLLSQAFLYKGDINGAEREARKTLEIAEAIYPSDAIEVDNAKLELCEVLAQTERTEKLDEALERLETLAKETKRLNQHNRLMMFALSGRVCVLLEEIDDAKRILPDLVGLMNQVGANVSPIAAAVYADLGRLAIHEQDWATAVEQLSKAVSTHEAIQSTNTFECAQARLSLGIALMGRNDQVKAREHLLAAVETFTQIKRTESSEAKKAAGLLAQMKSVTPPSDKPVRSE